MEIRINKYLSSEILLKEKGSRPPVRTGQNQP